MASNNLNLNKIKVLSANCRGLKDKFKRYDVLNYLKDSNADIICLQDTHLMESVEVEFKKYWDGTYILHGERHNARGVALLFGNNFEYTISHIDKDSEGNMIVTDLKVGEVKIRLLNIYGPNTNNEDFYNNIAKVIDANEQDYLIWCGDFNLVLDPQLDSNNYVTVNNPKNRNIVLHLMHEYNLIDIFRHYYPSKKRYTWHKNKPLKQARLDYFLASSCFSDLTTSIEIKPSYRSDHSILELTFQTSNFKRCKGT